MCTRMDTWEAGLGNFQADGTTIPDQEETPSPVHTSLCQPLASSYHYWRLAKTSQCQWLWWKLGFLALVAMVETTTHRQLLPQTHRGLFLLQSLQSQIQN